VRRIDHVPPSEHAGFYRSCRYTLNLTRRDMILIGYSPSVRLFEAAACGTPIISDAWDGVDELFEPGRDIALARSGEDVVDVLTGWSEQRRLAMGRRARRRILAEHTSMHRARELEDLLSAAAVTSTGRRRAAATRDATLAGEVRAS
jgi:spore maturation protein CgeB